MRPAAEPGPLRPNQPERAGDFVAIAEVVKAVGLSGQCRLYPLLDWHAPLLGSRFLVWESGQTAVVTDIRLDRKGPVVRFHGCRDRDRAEGLVGLRLGFLREGYLAPGFPKPPGGLPFRYVGREVRLVGGEAIGRVEEVRRYGPQLTLVLGREGREVLVPALEPILQPDDGLEGPLVIDPPEGLLNAAGD